MAEANSKTAKQLEVIEPVGLRVLVRKDEDKKETKGGIILPDSVEIPVLTGRVVAISRQVERDDDFPVREYDKVIVNPSRSVPVDFDNDNKLFLIPIQDVVAIIRRQK